MKQVYAPANAVEAHMLAQLLDREGIVAHIHGEALQGGVGELPAAGLLQLLVVEEDYERARDVIMRWERLDGETTANDTRKNPSLPLWAGLGIFALGLMGGWAIRTAALTNALPIDISEEHLDLNGDGRNDTTYFFRLGAPYAHKAEYDRNFDGAIDLTDHFDWQGTIELSQADDDFDGRVERRTNYANGGARSDTVDAGQNRLPARRFYHFGILSREELIDPNTGRIARINHYVRLRLDRSEIDTDRDGYLETIRSFDALGEVENSEVRQPG